MADPPSARGVPDMPSLLVRARIIAIGLVLSLASAAWIVPAEGPTYAVFLLFAFAFSFVWLDSDAPTSVAYMATTTAFVYIAGFPVLFLEMVARLAAYPVLFLAARLHLRPLPRALRPLVQADRVRAADARLDLAAMLGLATIGSTVRVVVIALARAAGIESLIAMIALGEPAAYAAMGALSARLPLPTAAYVTVPPHRLPAEDERVDVVFSAVLIVPFLVLLIAYGWLEHGLVGAAAWSLASLAPHGLVQLLVRRRHMLDERHVALEGANAALAQKQAELEEFTYTVAHDLKAPLSAITMTADLVLDAADGTLPDAVRGNVAKIVRLAGETETMIVDLLRMVRIVSEPEPVEMVDLGVVTAQAVEVLRSHLAARGVQMDVQEPLPTLPGQATKLRHMLSNLIGNAIRFVPPGTGTIGVSATREGRSIVLAVQDNGVGIPAEYHQAIFEMFRRVPDGNGREAGSGMGLAIVKRIVETHGGQVWVESAPGKGSVFWVRLPAG
jgi:signal transduction histidine kinase